MAAITVSRQLGSRGFDIASLAAGQLGFRLIRHELINQAAQKAGAPEAALAAIDELGLLDICPSLKACHRYQAAMKQVIEGMADEGNVVIIGRAGQVLLKDRPDVLHIRVIAPIQLRIERVAQKQGVTLEGALAQVEASDRYRAKYVRRFYHVRWDDPQLYDLVINTARITPEIGADLVCQALAKRLQDLHQITPT